MRIDCNLNSGGGKQNGEEGVDLRTFERKSPGIKVRRKEIEKVRNNT